MKRIVICLLLSLPLSVLGQGDEKARLEAQIKKLEKEIGECNTLLDKKKKDRTLSESQLKVTRVQLDKKKEMVASLGRQARLIENDITNRKGEIGKLNGELEGLKKEYGEMVYAAWKIYKHNDFLLFLFSSEDFNDAARRADFMRRYNRARQDKAIRIAEMSENIRGEVSKLDATRAELDKTRGVHSREAKSLAESEKTYTSQVKQLTADQKKLQKQVSDKQAQRKKAQQKLDALIAAEIARQRQSRQGLSDADLRAMAALSGRFEDNRGRLPYPITGGVVIERYGEHAHPFDPRVTTNNKGVNIAGVGGATVKSVFEGTVASVDIIPGYNNYCVMVAHGSYITVYANLVGVSVRNGEAVTAGQTLGRIASSTDHDNNFVHFEIHSETTRQNPEQWLRK